MKKTISLLLALTLFLCGSYARAEDRAVASVNGVSIWESELLRRMTASAVLNQQSGDEITNEERTARDTALRIQVLDALIEERVLLNEAEKRGLTADFLREDIDMRFRKMIGAVAAYVLASYPGLEGEALLEQVESLLKTTGSSLDSYYETAATASILAALEEQLLEEAPLPDECVLRSAYEALWQEQKALFDTDENAFEAAMLSGSPVVYRPRALKMIQKAEFLFEEGALALIGQTEAVSPENAQSMWEDQSIRALEKAQTAWMALKSGEISFDELLVRLGGASAVNYYGEGSTRFSAAYAECVAAFQRPGEFSAPFLMKNGYAILFYQDDLPPCLKVDFEMVRQQLMQSCLQDSSQAFLREAKEALLTQACIQRNEGPEE